MTAVVRLVPIAEAQISDAFEVAQAYYRQAWSLLGLLLTPVAVVAGALGAWRFGVDAGWTGTFFIAEGLLSHWQVWCAFAITAEVCAYSLSFARERARARS
jgi:hypothetical protein